MTLGPNQQLRGDNGAYIRGSVIVPATANIAPGGINNSNYQYMIIGTNLTYQAGSTNYMDIYKAGTLLTNDLIIVSNQVNYGSATLVIQTNGSTSLAVNDSTKDGSTNCRNHPASSLLLLICRRLEVGFRS